MREGSHETLVHERARGGGPRSNTNPNPGDYIHNVVNVFHRSAIAGSAAV
jgi:hypothetical protein